MHPSTIQIIPGVLEQEWNNIEQKLQTIKGFSPSVHVDIIDGIFVDNQTFLDPTPFLSYSQELFLELHMMVQDPITYIEPFAHAGFKRFIGQIEMMPDQQAFIDMAKKYGEAGLAIDGPTSLEKITVPLDSPDCFLVYTSEKVGFSGPPLLDQRLEKVTQLRAQTSSIIEVDGGITDKTLPKAIKAGANRAIATSFIFSNSNPEKNYKTLTALGE